MRDVFLDFVDEPKESPRRTREGIYESYEIISGNIFEIKLESKGNLRIKLVLLDVRFNRDEINKDILGRIF
jgi:hypothetical protein